MEYQNFLGKKNKSISLLDQKIHQNENSRKNVFWRPGYGVKEISSYFDIFMIFVYFLKCNLKNYASWSLRLWKHRGYMRHALNFPKIYFGNPRTTGTLIYRIFSPTPLPPVCLDIPPLQYFPYIYIYGNTWKGGISK